MAERIQKRVPTPERRREEETNEDQVHSVGETATKGAGIKEELDGLLDEIDEVLEENAEEFVKGYVQKGGE
ncbi:ubiquitin-like protein Pup [Candidatus Saccharibacteria bacterium]|nr:ubiquitin-like protein Pup [Candidatus Saccharibacteria bacterium]MBI3338053.1 ubiquitin-like protein Pup [Candidatus Saccharibacteria bacterium]